MQRRGRLGLSTWDIQGICRSGREEKCIGLSKLLLGLGHVLQFVACRLLALLRVARVMLCSDKVIYKVHRLETVYSICSDAMTQQHSTHPFRPPSTRLGSLFCCRTLYRCSRGWSACSSLLSTSLACSLAVLEVCGLCRVLGAVRTVSILVSRG